MSIVKMTDLDLRGKRVLIREDLNVPIKDLQALINGFKGLILGWDFLHETILLLKSRSFAHLNYSLIKISCTHESKTNPSRIHNGDTFIRSNSAKCAMEQHKI